MPEKPDFTEWVVQELENRGWSIRELARRGHVSAGSLSAMLNKQRGIGNDLCFAIAEAFHLPVISVFQKAGILPQDPLEIEQNREFIHLFESLSKDEQETVFIQLRALVASKEKKGR